MPIKRRHFLSWIAVTASVAAMARRAFAQGKDKETGAQGKDSDAGGNDAAGSRAEPLFVSETDARAVIREHCTGDVDAPITEQQIDLLVSRLKPQFWLAHHRDGGWLCETRLGGAPDLPKGSAWPMRPVPPDASQKAEQWKVNHRWIARHITQELPFEFIGQIDFAELSRELESQFSLPAEGRLLFFWDGAVGLLESGSHTCRVIFDETPSTPLGEHIERLQFPAKFDEMEAWWREPDPKATAHFQKMAETLAGADQNAAAQAMRNLAEKSKSPDPHSRKPFVYPARAMKLVPLLVLPSQNSIELTQDAELTAFANGDDTSEHYTLLTSNDMGPFSADRSNMRRTQDYVSSEARRVRLLGPPHPEQDDPRFDALPKSELPPYPWNDAQIAETSRKAADWLLLLQVSIADLTQLDTEGTVYFMVHKEDFAKRDFSRVVASYQQT